MLIRDCTVGVVVLPNSSGVPVLSVLSLRVLLWLSITLVISRGSVGCVFPLSLIWCVLSSREVAETFLRVLLRVPLSLYMTNDVGLGPLGEFCCVSWAG